VLADLENIQEFAVLSKHDLFTAFYKGKKVFVKQYKVRKGRRKGDIENMRCEMLCYSEGGFSDMVGFVGKSEKERVLVLEFCLFTRMKKTKKNIDRLFRLFCRDLQGAHVRHLLPRDYENYLLNVYLRARDLQRKKIIRNYALIRKVFELNKKKLIRLEKNFSQGDFTFNNCKTHKGKIIVTDFEQARKDTPLYDLATLYVDLYSHPILREYFLKKVKRLSYYDSTIFQLMKLRRAIELLYGFQFLDKRMRYFVNSKTIVDEFNFENLMG